MGGILLPADRVSPRWKCVVRHVSASLRCGRRPAPGRRTLTAQGHPRAIFNRAVERGNLLIAETTAREIGRISLVEALQLTALIAQKDPRRHARVAARWLFRYLEEHEMATIGEAALVTAALVALDGAGHDEAYVALMGMAERASRRACRTTQPMVP